jgi:hypothetical protein
MHYPYISFSHITKYKNLIKTKTEVKKISAIIGGLAKFAAVWFTAGAIASAITILFIYLAGGLIGLTTELIMTSVISSLPFPISIFVSYSIDPVSFMAELILQILVSIGILYFAK